ncbi:DNA-binding proteins Bright/BRCAA1/RBP1 and proteins containing BRIGHT domain [Hypoxylon texense]
MAFPSVRTLEDCADYSKVVEPYLPQLYELPWKVIDVVSTRGSLLELYKNTNPLVSGLGFSIFLGVIFLVASEVNRNYSQVDPAPTYIILLASNFEQDVTGADLGFAAVQLSLILSEWFSDQQQWDYHAAKHEYQKTAKVPRGCGFTQAELDRGFNTSGLWAYCRHPNFAAEQTIWFVLYQWSCFASKTLYNWAGLGSVFLIMVFQGSTWLTELISLGKYPEYEFYQKQVGAHIPSLTPYKAPSAAPKVIRTSDLAKRQKAKQK